MPDSNFLSTERKTGKWLLIVERMQSYNLNTVWGGKEFYSQQGSSFLDRFYVLQSMRKARRDIHTPADKLHVAFHISRPCTSAWGNIGRKTNLRRRRVHDLHMQRSEFSDVMPAACHEAPLFISLPTCSSPQRKLPAAIVGSLIHPSR